jgi:hypothetical protein
LASSSDELHVSFTRSGGIFAGNRLALELDEAELSPDEAAALSDLAQSGELERDLDASQSSVTADEYQYDLTLRRGESERALRFTESSVPPALAPLVRLLERRAEDEARRRRRR